MAYVRKTVDIWVVEGDYGCGFEAVTYEDTKREALEMCRCYRENEPYPFRIKKRRFKKAEMYE